MVLTRSPGPSQNVPQYLLMLLRLMTPSTASLAFAHLKLRFDQDNDLAVSSQQIDEGREDLSRRDE